MCMGGSSPPPPAALPEAPRLPSQPSDRATGDIDRRRKAAASKGGIGTILTSARGVTQQGAVAGKTLLGE